MSTFDTYELEPEKSIKHDWRLEPSNEVSEYNVTQFLQKVDLIIESSKTGLVCDKIDIVHGIFIITEAVLSSCKCFNSLISKTQ